MINIIDFWHLLRPRVFSFYQTVWMLVGKFPHDLSMFFLTSYIYNDTSLRSPIYWFTFLRSTSSYIVYHVKWILSLCLHICVMDFVLLLGWPDGRVDLTTTPRVVVHEGPLRSRPGSPSRTISISYVGSMVARHTGRKFRTTTGVSNFPSVTKSLWSTIYVRITFTRGDVDTETRLSETQG